MTSLKFATSPDILVPNATVLVAILSPGPVYKLRAIFGASFEAIKGRLIYR